MTTTVSTTENMNDNDNTNNDATNAVAWPYHVNPETGRANKCYKVDRCRFGIPADQHYATAAEALAHISGTTAPAAATAAVTPEKVPAKRGRPAKAKAAVAETPAAPAEEKAPAKRRGRPAKAKVATAAPAEEVLVEDTSLSAEESLGEVSEVVAAAEKVAAAEVPASEPQASAPVPRSHDGILTGPDRIAAQKHDARVNKLYVQREEQQALLTGNLRTLAHRMGINLKKRIDPEKVIARAEQAESRERIQKYLDWAKENLAAVEDAQQKIERLDKEYSGWNRYFIVPGGHIHTSTQCRTCNHSWEHPTQFEWLTNFSGAELKDVVDQHGAVLCTVCFTEAPLDWTNYFDRLAEEKKKTQCSGSATWDYDLDTARLGQPTGNYGICEHCGEKISITSTGKLRAHRTPAVVDAAEAVTADAAKAKA